jgi:hypothetical protein
MATTSQRAQNRRTGMFLVITFFTMLVGCVVYIIVYHS